MLEKLIYIYKKKSINILDIGTGSGCIILSLLSELKSSKGIGIDISPGALQIAKKNAKKHKIFAGIHNATPEYAKEMIALGFNLVTVGADQRFMSSGAKKALSMLKDLAQKVDTKGY